jgi:hypothetical protein
VTSYSYGIVFWMSENPLMTLLALWVHGAIKEKCPYGSV